MGNWMIGANVDVKSFVGEQMFQDKIFPKLAEREADVFPLFFGCPRLSLGAKANDPTAQISHALYFGRPLVKSPPFSNNSRKQYWHVFVS
jgi:hypothetical protein